MRRSHDHPGSRPRRGRRLAAAALTVGLAGAAAAITRAGPSVAGSDPVAQLTVSPAQPLATVPGTASRPRRHRSRPTTGCSCSAGSSSRGTSC